MPTNKQVPVAGVWAQGKPCFKKCGFIGHSLKDIYAHYQAEPTHHRNYGKNKLVAKGRHPRKSHLSVVGSKVQIGRRLDSTKTVVDAKTGIAALRQKLALEIAETFERLTTLKNVEDFLNRAGA